MPQGKGACLGRPFPCITAALGMRRTKHAVYDLKYQLVWISKYRKSILGGEISGYLNEVFQQIAEEYELGIDTMEVVEDHVHIFVKVPPRYSQCK